MNNYTKDIYDHGICDFCGQPIELRENFNFIRKQNEYHTRVVHTRCWEERVKENEDES